MKSIITEGLEKRLAEAGLGISNKKEDEFVYVITVPVEGKGEYIIYTTEQTVKREGLKCFKMCQVSEHIPFEVVTPDEIKKFIWKWEDFCLSRDLPLMPFETNEKAMFLPTYLDIINKSGKCFDTWYKLFGFSDIEIRTAIKKE